MAIRFGARGSQVVHCLATGAFHGEGDKFTLTQFTGACPTADILHFKITKNVVALARLSTGDAVIGQSGRSSLLVRWRI